jgi:hypothetical protein
MASFPTNIRAQMLLDPSVTNLNTGSFGPLPRDSQKTMIISSMPLPELAFWGT